MDQRAAYLLEILDKIGAPLMAAIIETTGPDSPPAHDAQTMAALLAKTVQASIYLGQTMDINPAQAMDDSLRVALAALSGPLVGGQYKKRGQLPDEGSIKRIIGSLQAVLAFSDNFAPSPESTLRLKDLDAKGQNTDASQTQVQYVQAFIPVVEAIAAFPFGQGEQKLMTEVSDRLVKKSIELRETLFPHMQEEAAQKRCELGLLRALATVYSTTHRAETEKVMRMGEGGREAGLSMAPVWQQFDLRAAMLETLAVHLLPGGHAQSRGGTGPAQAPVQDQMQTPVQRPPSAPPPTQPTAPPTSGNPMSMFAKPKTSQETQGSTPPSPPPPPEAPVENPSLPAQNSNQTEGGSSESQGGQSSGGGPMSFFKKSE